MKKVFLLGATGNVGTEFVNKFNKKYNIITQQYKKFNGELPDCDIVVNCGAYTDVAACEKGGGPQAYAYNNAKVKLLGTACKEKSIPLIHISTDYVYDSDGNLKPENVYGKTKLEGEENLQNMNVDCLIIRTSSICTDSKGIVNTFTTMLQDGKHIKAYDNVYIRITNAYDLACYIDECIQDYNNLSNKVVGFSSIESQSVFNLATSILKEVLNGSVEATTYTKSDVGVKRPMFSHLDKCEIYTCKTYKYGL